MAFPFAAAPPACPPPWETPLQLRLHLARLLDDVELLTAVADELEALISAKEASVCTPKSNDGASTDEASDGAPASSLYFHVLRKAVEERGSGELESIEALALVSATTLQQSITSQLAPLVSVLGDKSTWEEAAAFARLSAKKSKMVRNRRRRKKLRQLAAKALRKEKERYDQADFEADEWRAKEIAKDIAKRKIEKMKEVAKRKAKEERQKLERELELVLIVEKLQELRSLRIQRLKKQGSFFPEEDNRFMERVKAAVEEEERQAAAAADTSATVAAIANAEEAGKAVKPTTSTQPEALLQEAKVDKVEETTPVNDAGDLTNINLQGSKDAAMDKSKGGSSQVVPHDGTLPAEFYHYYYGSSVDIGTLIEVRRLWDSFLLPGGSRIPGHWVQPPPPADPVWGSCLLTDSQS